MIDVYKQMLPLGIRQRGRGVCSDVLPGQVMCRSVLSSSYKSLFIRSVLIELVGAEVGGDVYPERHLEEALLIRVARIDDSPIHTGGEEPRSETGTASPFPVGNRHLVGLVRVKIDQGRSEIVISSHFFKTVVPGCFENPVPVQIKPNGCPVVLVRASELMQAAFLWGEHGQEQGHVIVIPVDPDPCVFEIVVPVEIESLSGTGLHDPGPCRLWFKSDQAFDVIEIRIVWPHEKSHSINRIQGNGLGLFFQPDPS